MYCIYIYIYGVYLGKCFETAWAQAVHEREVDKLTCHGASIERMSWFPSQGDVGSHTWSRVTIYVIICVRIPLFCLALHCLCRAYPSSPLLCLVYRERKMSAIFRASCCSYYPWPPRQLFRVPITRFSLASFSTFRCAHFCSYIL